MRLIIVRVWHKPLGLRQYRANSVADGKVPGKGYGWETGTCLGRVSMRIDSGQVSADISLFPCCLQYPLLKDTGTRCSGVLCQVLNSWLEEKRDPFLPFADFSGAKSLTISNATECRFRRRCTIKKSLYSIFIIYIH